MNTFVTNARKYEKNVIQKRLRNKDKLAVRLLAVCFSLDNKWGF